MNIGKLTAIIAMTASIGAVGPAFAAGSDDETGMSMLGIDISRAGTSQENFQQFVAGLAPDTQRLFLRGCETAMADPAAYAPNVFAFCQTALNVATPASPVLGFIPEEAPFVAPTPAIQPSDNPAY
jgi:hypothetical protein